jgi:hypothetical protein
MLVRRVVDCCRSPLCINETLKQRSHTLVEFVQSEECVMLVVAVGSATRMVRHCHAATRAVLVEAAPDTACAESMWAAAGFSSWAASRPSRIGTVSADATSPRGQRV